ncbi:hypothetical protein CROQUDRAFT_102416 [Cronartium quercuum f. sp. fusiforme G11]|uniref:Uncharacterized protein n=1 Tax=Cronartium quercuum f. sp. fusiforme G11 TaxID=708437 RepID=A0A9P6N5B5_9BASI|nr:hypothetical protein CROQUDRAFT_102416 [Cronartium quercuum f. sp. fusiforme G11]
MGSANGAKYTATALKSSIELSDVEKIKRYDETQAEKVIKSAHLAVYEGESAYLTSPDKLDDRMIIADSAATRHMSVTLLSLHQLATDGCKFFGDLNSLWINGLPGDSSIIATKNLQSHLWEIKQLPT